LWTRLDSLEVNVMTYIHRGQVEDREREGTPGAHTGEIMRMQTAGDKHLAYLLATRI